MISYHGKITLTLSINCTHFNGGYAPLSTVGTCLFQRWVRASVNDGCALQQCFHSVAEIWSVFSEIVLVKNLNQLMVINFSTQMSSQSSTWKMTTQIKLDINQSTDILQHSQNRPTGDRWLKL